jgi:hypothetical protein
LHRVGHRRDACPSNPKEDAKMTRLIAATMFMVAVTAPAMACEWNKSAQTGSQSTVASQTHQQSKPTHQQSHS